MTLNPNQVIRIQILDSGWEQDWGQLAGELIPRMDKLIRKQFRALDKSFRNDLRQSVLLEYHQSVQKRRLLANFDPESGDPVNWLLGTAFKKRLVGHLKRLSRKYTLRELDSEPESGSSGHAPHVSLDSELVNLKFKFPREGLTRPVLYAGIQLYPRLDTSAVEMRGFADELLSVLAANLGLSGREAADEWLKSRHSEIAQELQMKLTALYDRLSGRRFREGDAMAAAESQIDRLERERVLYPLNADIMAEALGTSRNNADQLRSRYRDKNFLVGLIPKIADLFFEISGEAPITDQDEDSGDSER